MGKETTVTIAIPAHNRARIIGETLASVAALRIPEGMFAECIVVDNNSTDDTMEVAEAFALRSPIPTRCLFEPNPGSSHARNRAIEEARGDYILFIDDDAVAEPEWAIELIAAIERRGLDAACGMVLPRWAIEPPRWLGPSLFIRLAVHDERKIAESSPQQLDTIHHYFSVSAGFRRRAFELFGGFRGDLGVIGGNPMSGEDTELFERIMNSGGRVGFAPRARVRHLIPPERMRRAYLRHKAFAFGFGSAIAGGPTHNHLDKLGRNALRMAWALMRGDVERAVYHELECANFLGYWRGRLQLNRERGDP
ncbi:MAG TPA: glycosyltransferase [Candidatus Binataceae bacterium]|nr:glycosyltransferase [Candidatus Binataceae bacterium]